jgi:hypothetical protein
MCFIFVLNNTYHYIPSFAKVGHDKPLHIFAFYLIDIFWFSVIEIDVAAKKVEFYGEAFFDMPDDIFFFHNQI